MQRYELLAWLGAAVDSLDEDDLTQLHTESDRIAARYPDPDQEDERQAAFSAAVQYVLADMRPDDAGRALIAARSEVRRAMAVAQQIAAMAAADGMSEVKAAEACAIDRMTLRKVLGKL